ncbi:unannotated protein [freshwater metagenome]|uniref:Unannotated protein n=1 Tax=freshwater metagenome TaxID=449393 RepID=A0A6J7E3H9_9ZZZZ
MNGGRVTSCRICASRARDAMLVTSSASRASRSGKMSTSRSANIVFPAPGGPSKNMWWPPAAAVTSASTTSGCPTMSDRSRVGESGSESRGGSMASTSDTAMSVPCSRRAWARLATGMTSMSGTSSASVRFPAGTMMRLAPASRAATTAGRTPATGRIRPSRASSPM